MGRDSIAVESCSSMTDTPLRPSRRLMHRLSAAFVRSAPPGFYCDGHGLNLRVHGPRHPHRD